ncbi:hypothetical protein ACKI1J_32680 [Streptomyces scabiei]|uniref:hypothetical protein n=1 Tax=Streptomyces scabiei TaxID=1930 RepID=UPI0039EF421C
MSKPRQGRHAEREVAVRVWMADWWSGKTDPAGLAEHLRRQLEQIGGHRLDRLSTQHAMRLARRGPAVPGLDKPKST